MNSELAKLIYDLDWNEERAFQVYNIRKRLTPTGFEYYVLFFFEKILGYKMTMPTSTYSPDWGIDLKGIRKNTDWTPQYCIVQCKKHASKNFWVNDIRAFVWWIYHILSDFPSTTAYYITTSCFTIPAKQFANKEAISMKDYSNIAKMYSQYNLEQFEKDIRNEMPKKYNQIFNKWKKEKTISAQWKLFSSQEDELLKTLKNIRYNIMKKTHIYTSEDITNDSVLELLSRKRPHSLDAFKSALYENEFQKIEIEKTLQYANEYIKGINLYV